MIPIFQWWKHSSTRKVSENRCVCFSAAMACLGSLFEQLGRVLVTSFRETLSNLLKYLKNAEVFLLLIFTNTHSSSTLLCGWQEHVVRSVVWCATHEVPLLSVSVPGSLWGHAEPGEDPARSRRQRRAMSPWYLQGSKKLSDRPLACRPLCCCQGNAAAGCLLCCYQGFNSGHFLCGPCVSACWSCSGRLSFCGPASWTSWPHCASEPSKAPTTTSECLSPNSWEPCWPLPWSHGSQPVTSHTLHYTGLVYIRLLLFWLVEG